MAEGAGWGQKILGRPLLIFSFGAMLVTLYLVFLWVPTERFQGIVQRIFYFHVPPAWVAFLAFFIVFVGSILYLWRGEGRWDDLAYSSAELGVVFTTVTLITGSLWGKPIWGVWWTWDPRLTATAILWLIYIAYLMIRAYVAEESRGARFAAVVGIVGFIDVPIVYLSIRWWRTLHPAPVVLTSEEGLPPAMLLTLIVSLVTFTALFIHLLFQRLSLRQMVAEVERLKEAQKEET
ncbi:MAG: cytochrome c biogenesis protein CcsA [Chloroflexi bacterium]|nr:cytochrome c biogenesis protein CcsA [Chloroflexota bacterium]